MKQNNNHLLAVSRSVWRPNSKFGFGQGSRSPETTCFNTVGDLVVVKSNLIFKKIKKSVPTRPHA
eukprot:1142304-Pelagomonas_calceolata.AAC.2